MARLARRYDPAKDEANRIKHGVPLMFGRAVFADANHVALASFRPIDGEDRYKAISPVEGRVGRRCTSSTTERSG